MVSIPGGEPWLVIWKAHSSELTTEPLTLLVWIGPSPSQYRLLFSIGPARAPHLLASLGFPFWVCRHTLWLLSAFSQVLRAAWLTVDGGLSQLACIWGLWGYLISSFVVSVVHGQVCWICNLIALFSCGDSRRSKPIVTLLPSCRDVWTCYCYLKLLFLWPFGLVSAILIISIFSLRNYHQHTIKYNTSVKKLGSIK